MNSLLSYRAGLYVLNEARDAELARVEARGFNWFRQKFKPALRVVRNAGKQTGLLADCTWLIGELLFVLDAPRASLRAYRDSYALRPSRFITEDMELARESAKVQADTCGPQVAAALELIACARPTSAMRRVLYGRTFDHQRVKARALGALGRHEEALDVWLKMLKSYSSIVISRADWFYLAPSIWEDVAFWSAMQTYISKCQNLGLVGYFDPSDILGPPEVPFVPTTIVRVHRLAVRFHLLRVRNDRRGLESLSGRYPLWRDVTYVVEHFRRYGRAPTHDELVSLTFLR